MSSTGGRRQKKPDTVALNAVSGNLVAAAQKIYGKEGVMLLSSALRTERALPFDGHGGNLPLQYLFGTNGLLLGRYINIIGPPAGGKTSFCWDLVRMLLAQSAIVAWIDTERKNNPVLIQSILQLTPEEFDERIICMPVNKIEEFGDRLQYIVRQYLGMVPDGAFPLVILVDSLSYLISSELIEKNTVKNNFDPGYAYARIAAVLTTQFKVWHQTLIAGRPILVLLINHEKQKLGDDGGSSTGPGGMHKDFQASWTLELFQGKKEEKVSETVWHRYARNIKNGMGIDKRSIEYLVRHHTTAEGVRLTEYDWDDALVRLLMSEKSGLSKEAIHEITGLTGSGDKWTSKKLKINDEVSRHDIGAAIHRTPEMVTALQRLFTVTEVPLFQAGVREKKEEEEKKATKGRRKKEEVPDGVE